ncbi:hypothetical protein [Pseudomonas syringae]|uniref:hypothetical protein n=1 Tax=Pseudomonas syringae TaxID=317 RepID=UPI00200B9C29|nr:hypothetical protein [Pseudomonas syringae]MCK9728527.1 hypothetical protein [Pseudomonas syringae pv. syringae]
MRDINAPHLTAWMLMMAVTFFTKNPSALLKAFQGKITQEEAEGSITTWEITKSGCFTHKGKQYARDAFFRASTDDGKLVFNIIRPEGKGVGVRTYGYYHGHLIETFLNHFDTQFVSASATALPVAGDDITQPA